MISLKHLILLKEKLDLCVELVSGTNKQSLLKPNTDIKGAVKRLNRQ